VAELPFCETCGAAVMPAGHRGHLMYGAWLSYRDFETILLALGASGSDVQRLWPADATDTLEAQLAFQTRLADSAFARAEQYLELSKVVNAEREARDQRIAELERVLAVVLDVVGDTRDAIEEAGKVLDG
jgi:hypothetical protein